MVDPRRVELGYDYCTKKECQVRCLERVELAAVGINKAADYYSRADEVPTYRLPAGPAGPDDQLDAPPPHPRSASTPAPTKRRPSTLDRLRQRQAELDAALLQCRDSFGRGDITAREMDAECDALIESFNQCVRNENIRYRSMLRPTSPHVDGRRRAG